MIHPVAANLQIAKDQKSQAPFNGDGTECVQLKLPSGEFCEFPERLLKIGINN